MKYIVHGSKNQNILFTAPRIKIYCSRLQESKYIVHGSKNQNILFTAPRIKIYCSRLQESKYIVHGSKNQNILFTAPRIEIDSKINVLTLDWIFFKQIETFQNSRSKVSKFTTTVGLSCNHIQKMVPLH